MGTGSSSKRARSKCRFYDGYFKEQVHGDLKCFFLGGVYQYLSDLTIYTKAEHGIVRYYKCFIDSLRKGTTDIKNLSV